MKKGVQPVFKKAFDLVDRSILFHKLISIGLPSDLCTLLEYVSSSMQFSVRSNGALSSPFSTSNGLPQGDPLSALLFSILIHDLPKCLLNHGIDVGIKSSKKLKYILYADDLVLLSNEPGDLQLGLNSLQQYCRDNNLVVNVSKTNVLPFYKGFPPKNLSPQFGDEPLKVVNEFVYLGITFTTRLSSSKHIRRIITKCKSRIAYLFTKLHISEIPLSTALDVFNIFILPIITYAIPVWFNTFSKTAGNLLNSCFTKYLKRFLAVPYSTNNALIYQITSTTPLLNSLTKIHQKQFNNLSFPLSMEGFKLNPTSPYCPPIPTSPDYINLCPIQLPTSSSIPVLKDPK